KEKRREVIVTEDESVAVLISPDGKVLATWGVMRRGGGDRPYPQPVDTPVQFWDVETGKALGRVTLKKSAPSAVAFAADGKTAAGWGVEGSKAVVWAVPSGKRLSPSGGHSNIVAALVFTPDGQELLSGGENGTEWALLRWDPITGKPLGKRVFEAPKNTTLPE